MMNEPVLQLQMLRSPPSVPVPVTTCVPEPSKPSEPSPRKVPEKVVVWLVVPVISVSLSPIRTKPAPESEPIVRDGAEAAGHFEHGA